MLKGPGTFSVPEFSCIFSTFLTCFALLSPQKHYLKFSRHTYSGRTRRALSNHVKKKSKKNYAQSSNSWPLPYRKIRLFCDTIYPVKLDDPKLLVRSSGRTCIVVFEKKV